MRTIIKILQAENGDAILISRERKEEQPKGFNILIDGGLRTSYRNVLKPEITKLLEKNEHIDLLIVTHIDRDHIGGILSMFEDEDFTQRAIKKVWFNSGDTINRAYGAIRKEDRNCPIADGLTVSIPDGIDLEKVLRQGKLWDEEIIKQFHNFEIDGLQLITLSPTEPLLKKLEKKWTTELEDKEGLGATATRSDYRKSIPELAAKTLGKKTDKDRSIPNGASLAFLVRFGESQVLLLGDAYSETIEEALIDLGASVEKPLKVAYTKLSHHGSRNNCSYNLLGLIDCQHFIICTKGTYDLPHKETLARILMNPARDPEKKITFHFNYDNDQMKYIFGVNQAEIDKAMADYKFDFNLYSKDEPLEIVME